MSDNVSSHDDDELMDALSSLFRADIAADIPDEPPADRITDLRRVVAQRADVEAPVADRFEAPMANLEAPVADRFEAPVADLDRFRESRSPSPLRWPAVAAAAALLVATGAVIGSMRDRAYPATGGELEYAGPITAADGTEGELEVVKIGIGRVVSLDTVELPILPTSEYYEIWFVAPDDTPDSPNRISAGTFHPDDEGRSEVTFAAAVDPAKYPVVEITAEPGDGNPSATGPVVMQVQIADGP